VKVDAAKRVDEVWEGEAIHKLAIGGYEHLESGRYGTVYNNVREKELWGVITNQFRGGTEKFLGYSYPTREAAMHILKEWLIGGIR
jgi:hypothetical protein